MSLSIFTNYTLLTFKPGDQISNFVKRRGHNSDSINSEVENIKMIVPKKEEEWNSESPPALSSQNSAPPSFLSRSLSSFFSFYSFLQFLCLTKEGGEEMSFLPLPLSPSFWIQAKINSASTQVSCFPAVYTWTLIILPETTRIFILNDSCLFDLSSLPLVTIESKIIKL